MMPSLSWSLDLKLRTRGLSSFQWFFSWKSSTHFRNCENFSLRTCFWFINADCYQRVRRRLAVFSFCGFWFMLNKMSSFFKIALASCLLYKYLTISSAYYQVISWFILSLRIQLTQLALLYGILVLMCIFNRSVTVVLSQVWTNLNYQSIQFRRILPKTHISLSQAEQAWMPETMLPAAQMVRFYKMKIKIL